MRREIEKIINLEAFYPAFQRFEKKDPDKAKHYKSALINAVRGNHEKLRALANKSAEDLAELERCLYREIIIISDFIKPYQKLFQREAELLVFFTGLSG